MIFKKIQLFITTAVKTSNPNKFSLHSHVLFFNINFILPTHTRLDLLCDLFISGFEIKIVNAFPTLPFVLHALRHTGHCFRDILYKQASKTASHVGISGLLLQVKPSNADGS
jgi:hypothetical protein